VRDGGDPTGGLAIRSYGVRSWYASIVSEIVEIGNTNPNDHRLMRFEGSVKLVRLICTQNRYGMSHWLRTPWAWPHPGTKCGLEFGMHQTSQRRH
jgi:hypothetical protein